MDEERERTHGFQYVYLPARARIPTGQMRARLRKLGIDNSRILDVHYPARQVIALLTHNDFVEELHNLLNKFKITPVPFDPLDPANLHDPKYHELPETERTQIAFELHCNRITKALNYIRAPIKYSVARSFANEGWIPIEELRTMLASRWPSKNHVDAVADIFHTDVDDTSMNGTESSSSDEPTNAGTPPATSQDIIL